HITLPMISPVIVFAVVTGVIYGFQNFTEGYIASGGAQSLGSPQGSLLFYPTWLYEQGFQYFHMGYASAMAWILFLITMVFTLVLLTALMTRQQALSTHLWPHPFRWSNFKQVFHILPLWRYGLNSFLYASLSTIGVVLSCVPVAYALSRLRWRGRQATFLVVL